MTKNKTLLISRTLGVFASDPYAMHNTHTYAEDTEVYNSVYDYLLVRPRMARQGGELYQFSTKVRRLYQIVTHFSKIQYHLSYPELISRRLILVIHMLISFHE